MSVCQKDYCGMNINSYHPWTLALLQYLKGAICKNSAPLKFMLMASESLWFRGRASVLLLEGRWFDFPGLHFKVVKAKVSLGKILNPKLLVGTLHGSHRHQSLNACMNYCKLIWTKVSANCPKWMQIWNHDLSVSLSFIPFFFNFFQPDYPVWKKHYLLTVRTESLKVFVLFIYFYSGNTCLGLLKAKIMISV